MLTNEVLLVLIIIRAAVLAARSRIPDCRAIRCLWQEEFVVTSNSNRMTAHVREKVLRLCKYNKQDGRQNRCTTQMSGGDLLSRKSPLFAGQPLRAPVLRSSFPGRSLITSYSSRVSSRFNPSLLREADFGSCFLLDGITSACEEEVMIRQ